MHPGLGVRQQALGQPDLLGAGGAHRPQVRQPVEHRDVGHPVGPRQLPGRLQPAGHAEVGQDRPGLVDHHDRVAAWAPRAPRPALEPRRGARHQDAECRRVVEGGQVQHDERPVEVEPRRRGAVEHAAQVAGDQTPQFERDVASVLGQRARVGADRASRLGVGASRASTTSGSVGTDAALLGTDPARQVDRHPLSAGSRSARGQAAAKRTEELAFDGRRRPRWTPPVAPRAAGPFERIQSHRAAGSQGHRAAHPIAAASVAVLALGVDHPGPAPEDRLAPQIGLDEGALAPADLAEHDHVRVGHHPLLVELERVEDERPAEEVVADQDAATAQPASARSG